VYIAGALDMLSTVGTADQMKAATHYNKCLGKAGMTAQQVGNNLREYVKSRPALQGGVVPHALMDYLIALCGKPQ
jgi:hypothetical protein